MALDDFLGNQDEPILSPEGNKAKCERCGKFEVEIIPLPSGKKGASRICDICRKDLAAEEEKRKVASRWANVENLLAHAGVPKRFLQCSLKNFNGFNRLNVQDRPTLISGPPGTGKTHLAVAYLAQALVHRGEHYGRFLESVELFLRLRDTFNKSSTSDELGVLKSYIDVPFLVLDDLGTEKLSDYVSQSLYFLINKRYGDYRDTIITSNLSLDEIDQNYGHRLASRIAGMGPELVLLGKDKRLE